MDKDGFVIYKSFYRPISRLSDEQLGRLFRAIFQYQLREVVSEVVLKNDVLEDDDIKMAFEFFKNKFDIDECKYQSKIVKNQDNARKGGAPKGNKNAIKDKTTERLKNNPNNRTVDKQPYKDKDKDKDKDITSPPNVVEDNTSPSTTGVVDPPSLLQMVEYFQSKGYTEQAAEKAFNYYTELGWCDSRGQPIRNWKLKCVSVWFKSEDKQPEKPTRPWGYSIPT